MFTQPLRDYQITVSDAVDQQWSQGARNVIAVMPTGAGKTKVFAHKIAAMNSNAIAIAHRSELVAQMSLALARERVRHRVVGPASLAKLCTQYHLEDLQCSFVEPNARTAVASVDTLAVMPRDTAWFQQIGLWVQDECHHVLKDNKWGNATQLFPNALGLGVTATPLRADGKGLGRHADGLFDSMVVGPSMRELIDRGFLCEYRVFAPPSNIDLASVPLTASGDYSPDKLKNARQRSTITGDVVAHYLRLAKGKRGITFDTDVESATQTAEAFRAAGVPAQVVSAKTNPIARAAFMRQFKAGDVLQLVNVDLFGEGTDVPAVEVVSMARPTQSFGLYVQQFGRALRILEGKERAIIIDHVGNVERHRLPDAYREWSLDRRERRSRGAQDGVIPLRTCTQVGCFQVYERALPYCPFCGHKPQIADRSLPDRVDGDLTELDPMALARLRGEADRVMGAPNLYGVPSEAHRRHLALHERRQDAQRKLRAAIALWAGWQHHLGRMDPEAYRRFYFAYGVDVATAQTLNAADASALLDRVNSDLEQANVKANTDV